MNNDNMFVGFDKPIEEVMEIEIDLSTTSNKSIKSGIERMLELGRELLQMSLRLELILFVLPVAGIQSRHNLIGCKNQDIP